MKRSIVLALLVVAACSHPPNHQVVAKSDAAAIPPPRPLFAEPGMTSPAEAADSPEIEQLPFAANAAEGSASVMSALGTPIHATLKAATCVASVVLAAPLAGLNEVSEHGRKAQVRHALHDGVGRNCGGSYALQTH